MVPLYSILIDIKSQTLTPDEFEQEVAPLLSILDHLHGLIKHASSPGLAVQSFERYKQVLFLFSIGKRKAECVAHLLKDVIFLYRTKIPSISISIGDLCVFDFS